MDRYADIMDLERPTHENDEFSRRHPKMSMDVRAKIFMPFAALKGYDDVVAQREVVYDRMQGLSEDMEASMNRTLQDLAQELRQGRHPVIHVRYFQMLKHETGQNPVTEGDGRITVRTGLLERLDPVDQTLWIAGERIPFSCLMEITILDR